MEIRTQHVMGALGALLDPQGPTVKVVRLSKAELSNLTKAADILEKLRELWGSDEDDPFDDLDTDFALAMYVIRELVEAQGTER